MPGTLISGHGIPNPEKIKLLPLQVFPLPTLLISLLVHMFDIYHWNQL